MTEIRMVGLAAIVALMSDGCHVNKVCGPDTVTLQ
jgi:hypothetical protein